MKRFRRWPKMRLIYFGQPGNCYKLWNFSRRVYWSGGLTYYSWWRFSFQLDWRENFLADLLEPAPERGAGQRGEGTNG